MPQSLLQRIWYHRILIGCSTLLWIGLIGGGVVAYRLWGPALLRARAEMKPPEELAMPRVVTGEGWLVRTLALSEARLGTVSAIVPLVSPPTPGETMLAAGSGGAVFLDSQLESRRQVLFPGCATHVDVIPPAFGRPLRFLNRGSWSCKTSLLDQDGQLLFRYAGGYGTGINDAVAGDLDGTGSLTVVIGFNGDGGVLRLDRVGQQVWKEADANVWHVELVDVDGSGRPVIVHSNAAGQLVLRDRTGRLLRPPQALGSYLSHFSATRWPGHGGPVTLLKISRNGLSLFSFNGEPVQQLNATLTMRNFTPRGTPVRLEAGQPEHFAVVGGWGPWRRSVLWVFTAAGVVAYQEILGEACGAIHAMPAGESGLDTLLVGCQGKILRYARPK